MKISKIKWTFLSQILHYLEIGIFFLCWNTTEVFAQNQKPSSQPITHKTKAKEPLADSIPVYFQIKTFQGKLVVLLNQQPPFQFDPKKNFILSLDSFPHLSFYPGYLLGKDWPINPKGEPNHALLIRNSNVREDIVYQIFGEIDYSYCNTQTRQCTHVRRSLKLLNAKLKNR